MDLDKWDWAMIIGMILIVVGFVVMAFMIGSDDGGKLRVRLLLHVLGLSRNPGLHMKIIRPVIHEPDVALIPVEPSPGIYPVATEYVWHEDEDPHVHHLIPLSAHDRGKICCDCNTIIEADES